MKLVRKLSVLSVLASCSGILNAADTFTLNQNTVALSCTKGAAACTSSVSVNLTDSTGTAYFAISLVNFPSWLQVSPMSGAGNSTPLPLVFTPSAAWVNLPVGVYTANVAISGITAPVAVTLQIVDGNPSLLVQPAGAYNVTWQTGTAFPQLSLTVYSTTTVPVPFTVSFTSTITLEGISNWLSTDPNSAQGMAYGWGTTVPLDVSLAASGQAQPGESLQGVVTITYGPGPSTKVVDLTIAVNPPPVVFSSISPASVPVMVAGTAGYVTISITGNYFVQNISQVTKFYYGSPSSLTVCAPATCKETVLNAQNMTVAIPYDATAVPFKAAGTLTLGLSNGVTTQPLTKTLTITNAPIVTSITSASSLMAPAPGALYPTIAPYDVISIFGSNFCPASIAGCSNGIVGAPDPLYFRYQTYLTPDNGAHKLSVLFSKISPIGTAWANVPGYLLFANNNQINAVVPAAIVGQLGTGTVRLVVGFDPSATSPAAANTSGSNNLVTVAAVNPGVFTLDSSGEGAILDNNILVTQSTWAAGGVDTVAVYMTGLGIPLSTGANAPGSLSPPAACIAALGVAGSSTTAPTGYMGTINTSAAAAGGGWVAPSGYVAPTSPWTTIDGAVIQFAMLSTGVDPPCFGATGNALPLVTIGGQSATVSYAGFVADSVAGLYQVNVAVPDVGNHSTPAQFPLVVTMGGVIAPTVQIWVQ
jgi:uncharacterized protein (TIGR03437 family)